MKKILVILVLGLTFQVFAGVSLLTGVILLGGDRVYEPSLQRLLDQNIRKVAGSIGEVCVLTEHFYFKGGLSYAQASFLMDSLERERWIVEELIPYGSSSGGRFGVWYMVRSGRLSLSRESALAVLYELRDGSGGVVSFCQL